MNSGYYVDTSYGLSSTTGFFGVLAGMMAFIWIIAMGLGILQIVAMWKIFVKAGKPGWAAIIPIYNIYIMCEIANKEWWYILLLCVPIVNIYAMFVIYDGIAKKFGKTTGFTIGMIFLPFIFFTILGLGKNSVYLDSMDSSNDTNLENEATQDFSQEETNSSNSYVNETQPISQTNTGYVAPNFDTSVEQNMPANGEAAPMMSEPVAPVVEPAPMMSEPVTPVVESAPTMSEPASPVAEPAPTMNEPVVPVTEPAPTMNEPVTPVVESAPTMNEPVAPVVEPTPMMSEPVAPVVEPTPMMSEPVAPVVEPAPMMSESVDSVAPQQEVNQTNSDVHTSLWSNDNTNNGQM